MANQGTIEQIPKFNPEQLGAISQALNKGLAGINQPQMQPYNFGPIRQGLEQNNFAPIAQREVSRFNTQTVPSIAERFTAFGQGGNSNRGSSAFTGALAQGGVDLGERLAALGSNFGLQHQQLNQNLAGLESQYGLNYNAQQQNQANNMLGTGLTQREDYAYTPPSPGFLQGLSGGVGQGIGAVGSAGALLGLKLLLNSLGIPI